MAVHEIKYEQRIPAGLAEVWEFIASPENLKTITPDYMNFVVTSKTHTKKMYPGMMITYKVSPLLGIPLSWCTEITQVSELNYFVDEQREGPYSIWHHQHHLKEIEGGVLMTDIIHYKAPLGILGRMMNYLLIRKQLQSIFDYRFKKVIEIFGKME